MSCMKKRLCWAACLLMLKAFKSVRFKSKRFKFLAEEPKLKKTGFLDSFINLMKLTTKCFTNLLKMLIFLFTGFSWI